PGPGILTPVTGFGGLPAPPGARSVLTRGDAPQPPLSVIGPARSPGKRARPGTTGRGALDERDNHQASRGYQPQHVTLGPLPPQPQSRARASLLPAPRQHRTASGGRKPNGRPAERSQPGLPAAPAQVSRPASVTC